MAHDNSVRTQPKLKFRHTYASLMLVDEKGDFVDVYKDFHPGDPDFEAAMRLRRGDSYQDSDGTTYPVVGVESDWTYGDEPPNDPNEPVDEEGRIFGRVVSLRIA